MTTQISRRNFIYAMSIALLISSLFTRTSLAADNLIVLTELSDRLTLFTGAGGNVVVHEGPDSVILIDGGSPEHAKALLDAINQRFKGKPITALVNTHWHLEQTGSNDLLGAKGVAIIAHENTKRWMTTRIEQHFGGPVFEPRAKSALPSRTFYISDELSHAGDTIRLVHTPRAHTDGDIHAVFEQSNVIVAGAIAYSGSYPQLDTATNGWIGEMLDATRTLIESSDENTIIVPANGGLLSLADLKAQEAMLDTILNRFKEYSRLGMGADDMLLEGIADEYVEKWGDPTEFILTAWDGLWDHIRGLGAF